jgi:hypothetical protein
MGFFVLWREENEGDELGVALPPRACGDASSSLVGEPPKNLTYVAKIRGMPPKTGKKKANHFLPDALHCF